MRRSCQDCFSTSYVREFRGNYLCEKCIIFYDFDPELAEYPELDDYEEADDDGEYERRMREAQAKAQAEA